MIVLLPEQVAGVMEDVIGDPERAVRLIRRLWPVSEAEAVAACDTWAATAPYLTAPYARSWRRYRGISDIDVDWGHPTDITRPEETL